MAMLKDLKTKTIIYQKVSSRVVTSYDQPTDIKHYKEVRNLATRQGQCYTTRYLLDHGYIKKHINQ